MRYTLTTMARQPEYGAAIAELRSGAWPGFLDANGYHWDEILRRFAAFQFLFVSKGDLMAVCHTLPICWQGDSHRPPDTIEEVIISAVGSLEIGKPATALAAVAILTSERCDPVDVTAEILSALKGVVREHGMQALLVPVRPALKSQYPLVPFEEFIRWKRADGGAFDPLLRLHWDLGAAVLGVAPKAVTVEGTVEEWQSWTRMDFSDSGEYIVEGAQRPVVIDQAADYGYYADPNLWMLHST